MKEGFYESKAKEEKNIDELLECFKKVLEELEEIDQELDKRKGE